MKCTQYFLHTIERPDRKQIKTEWIMMALEKPIHQKIQTDGRFQKWIWVEEVQKYLRVITLTDGETVHNAFFDRNFKI